MPFGAVSGLTTPSTYTAGTPGTWDNFVGAITPAAIDAAPGHGIQDPIEGSLFTLSQ
jgi:hypothetical protein